jgi:hypothetical protein
MIVFIVPRVEAGYDTSTVALGVVEDDRKGTQCSWGLTGPLCHRGT